MGLRASMYVLSASPYWAVPGVPKGGTRKVMPTSAALYVYLFRGPGHCSIASSNTKYVRGKGGGSDACQYHSRVATSPANGGRMNLEILLASVHPGGRNRAWKIRRTIDTACHAVESRHTQTDRAAASFPRRGWPRRNVRELCTSSTLLD